VLFLAAAFAPFFEEALFRGALQRGVRRRYGPVVSGLIVAFIFAVIHPQGFLLVPALGALGFGFAMLREWRGSLIAPMVAHAVHNGTLVTFMWMAF
jgi:membrane protease YdiL (CAAX protease family)